MNQFKILSAAVITAGFALASQAALAYTAGDVFVRGGVAKTDIASDDSNVAGADVDVESENGLTYGVGYLFHDKFGVELNSSEGFEHDLTTDAGDAGSVERLPVNALFNYYPMGGVDSRIQPYVGVGLNYTNFYSEDTAADISVDDSYGAIGQAGLDLAVTDNILLNGYVSYADVDADIESGGANVGAVDIDPVTVGGGVTYRF
ncbi:MULTISPECIES: OmpW/AlkL family protein [unclassified Halomonas]|uniref:OmpW/AlkL family protein n=1 Tax=unclassified Halomonas TaxID=2609666 RepID=UPI0006DB33E7|nr:MULTISPECIES: OmpW family outer membrane protein [unclassified Halomonas]KPQ24976.1 MAG: OmpW family outer membrane protein [Halomonas sp. HL-93]SBR48215.1 outer membrane protein [Halomonas sp. HL-93]SNY95805.1 outer membrane protein [Halomonas sp. hl-4]